MRFHELNQVNVESSSARLLQITRCAGSMQTYVFQRVINYIHQQPLLQAARRFPPTRSLMGIVLGASNRVIRITAGVVTIILTSATCWRDSAGFQKKKGLAHLFKGLITTLPKNGKRHK